MVDKTNFTKEEWTLLLKSPMVAGMAITAADPSGLWGLLKESFAGGAALTKAATDPNANALVKAVVADFSASEGRTAARDGLKADFAGGKPADIKTKSIDSLRQVSSLLAAKTPKRQRSARYRARSEFDRSSKTRSRHGTMPMRRIPASARRPNRARRGRGVANVIAGQVEQNVKAISWRA
jgi:hypothetical protein